VILRLRKLVVHPRPVAAYFYESSGPHDCKMAGNLVLRLSERFRKGTDARFTVPGKGHGEPQARWVGEDSEQGRFLDQTTRSCSGGDVALFGICVSAHGRI
jgi:hypothetical protein